MKVVPTLQKFQVALVLQTKGDTMQPVLTKILLILFSITTFGFASADSLEIPIVEGPGLKPIRRVCKPHSYKFSHDVTRLLQEIKHSVQCNRLGDALELLAYANHMVEEEYAASKTPRGWCYEKRGCTGDLVYKSIITKNACDAASGKSWKQTTPKAGKCKRVN